MRDVSELRCEFVAKFSRNKTERIQLELGQKWERIDQNSSRSRGEMTNDDCRSTFNGYRSVRDETAEPGSVTQTRTLPLRAPRRRRFIRARHRSVFVNQLAASAPPTSNRQSSSITINHGIRPR